MTIRDYLFNCRELNQLTTQNGWIDNDTLVYEVGERNGSQVIVTVRFEELVMEGSGCLAMRVPCYGQVRLDLDESGEVRNLDVLWPSRGEG